ncbi:hypothetical protein [Butyrivibrio sp. YAB3001]|uniref:hypothetical protein n=1 Tax=Butyrivibrio sp. YAB3001 TaxID=1520812 RepID=UPI0008F66D6A|nr:hypothetical protein [Butyrivibrio sp. YAB3001]SFB76101.1 hypothetical protein SAMN02910398_00663 [Butyrivibrio sp. YAB3001]
MKKKRSHGANVGSASILLIFTVLSLVSFATLTLVNSKADYNLSQNLADRQIAYYSACHQGNAFVAAVNSGYETENENGIIKKSIPITDNQSLDITIISNNINNSDNSSSNYTITQWQIVNNAESVYDYTLPVFK